ETTTYSFPSAAGQSVPSVSTGSSSASGRLPRCHSRSTHTCFAMPVGSSSRTTAMTPGPCSTTSGTRTSSTRSDTPKWRPTDSRTFGGPDSGQPHVLGWSGALGAFWTGVIAIVIWLGKRQIGKALRLAPRTRFVHRLRNPFDHLGIGASFPRREHPLDHLDCGLDLLIRHRLNAALVLDLHFFRHQHCTDLQIRGRRFASNPLEHLAPMLLRWPRHAGPAALPWPQEHPAHRQVHRNGARPLQGLLEGLTVANPMSWGGPVRSKPFGLALSPLSSGSVSVRSARRFVLRRGPGSLTGSAIPSITLASAPASRAASIPW